MIKWRVNVVLFKEKVDSAKSVNFSGLTKWRFSPGETLEDKLAVNSEEGLGADEIRCEIGCVEESKRESAV